MNESRINEIVLDTLSFDEKLEILKKEIKFKSLLVRNNKGLLKEEFEKIIIELESHVSDMESLCLNGVEYKECEEEKVKNSEYCESCEDEKIEIAHEAHLSQFYG